MNKQDNSNIWTQTKWWNFCPDPLALINLEGYFVTINPAWTQVLGWEESDLRSVPYHEFLHPEDLVDTGRIWNEVVHGGICSHFKNRYLRPDGTYKALSWSGVREGNFVLAQARDIESYLSLWTVATV